jgi:hypothetical protein
VTLNWDDYESFDPGVWGPWSELPRRAARAVFQKLMHEKPRRIDALRRLLSANGLELSDDDAGIQELNDWFVKHVEADPGKPGRLRPIWYAVVNDIALFLGDVMISRYPGLRWEFFTRGKKDIGYQRNVIMGFTKVQDPKYYVDIGRLVAGHGHDIVKGLPVRRGEFLHWFEGLQLEV